jgi:hypothetical protein
LASREWGQRSDPLGLVSPNLCPKTCSSLRVIGLPQAHNQISDFVAMGRPARPICDKIKIA